MADGITLHSKAARVKRQLILEVMLRFIAIAEVELTVGVIMWRF